MNRVLAWFSCGDASAAAAHLAAQKYGDDCEVTLTIAGSLQTLNAGSGVRSQSYARVNTAIFTTCLSVPAGLSESAVRAARLN